MSIKIIVAAHKKYWMPTDPVYLPVHVGAEGKDSIGYTPDNTGENISAKNPYFCELTGLYWAWKNLDADFIGLVHYRRYFTCKEVRNIDAKKNKSLPKKSGRPCWISIRSSFPISENTISRQIVLTIIMPIIQKDWISRNKSSKNSAPNICRLLTRS